MRRTDRSPDTPVAAGGPPSPSLSSPRAMRVLSVLLAAGAVAVVLYAVIVVAAGEFHADFTDTVLWAEATFRSGRLFDPDFYYAAAMPFGGQWLMLPFLPLFGTGMAAHTAGMVLFSLFLAGAVALLARRALRFSPVWTAVAVASALLCVSGSEKMRELYWGHIIYYSLGSLFLTLGLALTVSALDAADAPAVRRRRWTTLGAACVWIFLSSQNGLQGLLTFVFPLLGALVLERWLTVPHPDGDAGRGAGWGRTITACFLACAAGLVVGLALTALVPTWYTDYYSTLAGPDDWMKNLLKLPRDWLTLLGYAPQTGTRIGSAKGLGMLLLFPGAAVLAVAPLILAGMLGRIRERGVRLLVLAHLCLSGAIVFAYVFGQISNVNWRLSPLVFTAALCSVALARELWRDVRLHRFSAAVVLPLALYCLTAGAEVVSTPADIRQVNLYYRLGAYLEEQGLDQGYATFWNASSVTIQSDGDVRVAPVLIENAEPRPYRYQSNRTWYETEPGREAWFLLLSEAEYRNLSATEPEYVARAQRTLEAPENYTVLVFSENCVDPSA